jgi:hypothetical protein
MTPWKMAMEAAAFVARTEAGYGGRVVSAAILALPEPPEFRAAREAEVEMMREARLALLGMLAHSCVSDAGSDMKDEEDHAAERIARALLARLEERLQK